MHAVRTSLLAALAAVALIGGTAQTASAATVTVAKWAMDDSGSTMADSSGHNHPGTLHNVATQQAGWSGKAFGFFSRPSYIGVPNATDLNPGSSNFSITMHVKFGAVPSSSVGDFDLLRKGLATTSGGSYKVEILQSGKAYCNFRGSSKEGYVASASPLTTGAWHTVTCTRTSSAVKVTVDGVTTTRTITTGSISNTSSLYIGAKDGGGADQLNGLLDAVSITKG